METALRFRTSLLRRELTESILNPSGASIWWNPPEAPLRKASCIPRELIPGTLSELDPGITPCCKAAPDLTRARRGLSCFTAQRITSAVVNSLLGQIGHLVISFCELKDPLLG